MRKMCAVGQHGKTARLRRCGKGAAARAPVASPTLDALESGLVSTMNRAPSGNDLEQLLAMSCNTAARIASQKYPNTRPMYVICWPISN